MCSSLSEMVLSQLLSCFPFSFFFLSFWVLSPSLQPDRGDVSLPPRYPLYRSTVLNQNLSRLNRRMLLFGSSTNGDFMPQLRPAAMLYQYSHN